MDNLYENYILKKKSNGFTLVELIVVIAILGVIEAIARTLLLEYVVGLLQNGYKGNHSISEMAECIGVIGIVWALGFIYILIINIG